MSAEDLRGKHVHFDCASGAAGDMTLGAMIDAGVPEHVIREALDAVGVGAWRLSVERVVKRGVAAVNVTVDTGVGVGEDGGRGRGDSPPTPALPPRGGGGNVDARDDGDHHHAGHHHHTHWSEIRKRIGASSLGVARKERALDIFERVARAEAKIHECPIDDVAFHEVGAVDAIVDIVGAAAALEYLDPASVSAASVAMGHGTVRCAHGILPVPAPASLEILREAGGIMEDGGLARELCTPTGAAILASAVTSWGPMPTLAPIASGYGAGDADLDDRANVMRVVIGRPAAVLTARGGDSVYRVEANVDDMPPELCEHAGEALFAAGAVDVWWTAITMKKGRPALQLSALAPDAAIDAVTAAVLRETTTIGVRFDRVDRRVLARRLVEVETRYGAVAVKVAEGEHGLVNAAPEYESCRRAAAAHGVPLKRVFAAAVAAFEATMPA